MKESYGYSEIGKTVIQTTISQRHQKYSSLMAITNNKVLSYQNYKGIISKQIFSDFFIFIYYNVLKKNLFEKNKNKSTIG